MRFWALLALLGLMCGIAGAQSVREVCPSVGVRPRGAEFTPSGIILTYFDGAAMWVYDIARNTRYPLPETVPCAGNCRVSPDFRWITYLNPQTMVYTKMRFNGTQRTPLLEGASDLFWWSEDTFLVWTPDHRAYLQREGDFERDLLPVRGIISVQPRGLWAVWLSQSGAGFDRYLLNLEAYRSGGASTPVYLSADVAFYNAYGWSPDGAFFAFATPTSANANGVIGAELYLVPMTDPAPAPRKVTDLSGHYGAVRLNGATSASLSWSPDSTRVAFWVIPLIGTNPQTNTGNAVLHVFDVRTGETTRYCGFATSEHTPNPPALVWSPDGTALAWAGNVEGDNKGYLLLAMDTASGSITELSEGVFPALGAPNVLAWGNP